MIIDYDKLTAFEASSIVVAAAGLALIGTEIFISMPMQTRTELASAFNLFDMHEQVATVSSTAQFSYTVAQDFMEEFDLAFNQTLSFPDQIGTPLIKFADSFSTYSRSMAINYQANAMAEPNGGEVLGAMFVKNPETLNVDYSAGSVSASSIIKHPRKQYYYHAPEMVSHMLQGKAK
jgi:hypothetical protein